MPFRRYTKRRGTGRKPMRRGIRTTRTAKPSGANMARLQKQVNRIARAVRKVPQTHYVTYSKSDLAMGRQYMAINLSNYSTGGNSQTVQTYGYTYRPAGALTFGSTTADLESNRIYDKSMTIQLKFSCGNELSNVNYTMFLVSLKDSANDGDMWDPTTGDLELVPGTHYTPSVSSTLGQVMINRKCFNIHYYKRFTIGNNGSALTSATARGQLLSERIFTLKKKLGNWIYNPTGDVWGNMATARDPSKQYYLLIFNDDNAGDLEYQNVAYNIVRSVSVYE